MMKRTTFRQAEAAGASPPALVMLCPWLVTPLMCCRGCALGRHPHSVPTDGPQRRCGPCSSPGRGVIVVVLLPLTLQGRALSELASNTMHMITRPAGQPAPMTVRHQLPELLNLQPAQLAGLRDALLPGVVPAPAAAWLRGVGCWRWLEAAMQQVACMLWATRR